MPYHVEHHSWPNVPFHKLKRVHELVKKAYEEERGSPKVPTGCDPSGEDGYLNIHAVMFKRMLKNVFAGGDAVGVSARADDKTAPLLADSRL